MDERTPARSPRGILAACPVPWDEHDRFMEPLFRESVARLASDGFRRLYIFGTAGEGYAVDTERFRAVVRAFVDEAHRNSATAQVGVIGMSVPAVVERIRIAHHLGARSFQVSLPPWGRCTDDDALRFFDEVCGTFTDSTFLHYNVGRTGRMLGAAEYRRIVPRCPNLVATKVATGSAAVAESLLRDVPELTHHFDVDVFPQAALSGPAALLASYAPLAPRWCHELFDAAVADDAATVARIGAAFVALGNALWAVPDPGPHMDGAYDKMLTRLGGLAAFPLRLLPPYRGFTEDDADRCRAVIAARFPDLIPA